MQQGERSCVLQIIIIIIVVVVIIILAGESAALPERNFKGKEKRAAQPATILPNG